MFALLLKNQKFLESKADLISVMSQGTDASVQTAAVLSRPIRYLLLRLSRVLKFVCVIH